MSFCSHLIHWIINVTDFDSRSQTLHLFCTLFFTYACTFDMCIKLLLTYLLTYLL